MRASCKFFLCLAFFYSGIITGHTQNNKWILGEWKGIGIIPGSDYSTVYIRTLKINIEYKNRFSGLLVQEVMDNKSIRIEKEVGGSILNDAITIVPGRTLYKKQPLHGFWADCNACKTVSTRLSVSADSLILTSETRLCGNYCDGYTTYYKALSNFDTATQRKLVQQFGSPLLAKIFRPVTPDTKQGITTPPANAKSTSVTPAPKQTGITGTGILKTVTGDGTTDKDVIDTAARIQLSRKNKTIATYDVSTTEIKIELFDNGEIDGDTITVYHNKQKIIDRQLLGLQPIVYTVHAAAKDRVHEFILVANNLGRIPPNTALMRITAGPKTYELFASTTLTDNASVVIIYSGQ